MSIDFCTDVADYLSYFQCSTKPRLEEGSVWYLYSGTAAHEIFSFNKTSKIIIMLRNPLDAIHSLYRFSRYIGIEKERSIDSVLDREQAYFSSNPTELINTRLIYQEAFMYYSQVRRFLDVFARSRVHVVLYDDLQRDASSVYRHVLEFLETRCNFEPEFVNVNKTGKIRSETFQRLISRLPSPIQRLAYLCPRSIRRPTYRVLHRLNTSYAPPPPMDPRLRDRLKTAFRVDVERLSALIQRDLTHWIAD